MKVSGQLFGREAIAQGYKMDSMGIPVDPNAIYDYVGIRYTELTRLVRSGLKPRKNVPLKREMV